MTKGRRNFRFIGANTAVTYAPGTVAAQGTDSAVSCNVPGAKVGDAALVTLAVPTAKIVVQAYVSAAGVVTIRSTNVAGTGTAATATVASVMVFRL